MPALRCAYCRGALGAHAVACPACAVLVHADCQLDRCPTLGCGSLEAWEWRDLDLRRSGASAGPRRWRVAVVAGALVALSALGGAVAGPALSWERPTGARTGGAEPTPPSRPWSGSRCGSTITTRTERSRAVRWSAIACGLDGTGETYSGWRRDSPPPIVRRHVLVGRRGADARVAVEVVAPVAEGRRRPERSTVPRRGGAPVAGELLGERRAVTVDVPAGTFSCTFRKERRSHPTRGDTVVETWTDPAIPVPVLEVVTWRPSHAPRGQLNRDVTELVALEVVRRDH